MNPWVPIVLGLLGLTLGACASRTMAPGAQSVFVAVQLPDGFTPNREQGAHAHTLIGPTVDESGTRFSAHPAHADYEMEILYMPNDSDPGKSLVSIIRMQPRVRHSLQETKRRIADMHRQVRDHQKWAESQAPRP